MDNFQKTNKQAGPNKRAGWNISKKINKRAGLNKGAGRDIESTLPSLIWAYVPAHLLGTPPAVCCLLLIC